MTQDKPIAFQRTDDEAARLGHPSYVWRAGQERRLALVRQWARLDGARILDAGCGVGMYTEQFRRFSPRVTGVEVDPAVAAQAAARLPGIVLAPAEALPFADGSFDVVFSHEVIEHVTDDAAAAAEMARVLAPGGRIVMFCPNRLYPFETHGHYWRGTYHFGNTPLINWLPDSLRNRLAPHVHAYTGAGLRDLFRGSAGGGRPPQRGLPRLRQRGRAPSRRGQRLAEGAVRAGAHADAVVRVEPLPGPGAARHKMNPTPTPDDRAFAAEVYRRLLAAYGEPTWRPYYQPMDELVLTFLSQNTSDLNSGRAFEALKARYPTWQAVLDAPVAELAETIRSGGLAQQKAPRIQAALRRILAERGEFSLDFLADLPVDEATRWLTSFDGIGHKTASIVLLFCFNQPAFPGGHPRGPRHAAAGAGRAEGF